MVRGIIMFEDYIVIDNFVCFFVNYSIFFNFQERKSGKEIEYKKIFDFVGNYNLELYFY